MTTSTSTPVALATTLDRAVSDALDWAARHLAAGRYDVAEHELHRACEHRADLFAAFDAAHDAGEVGRCRAHLVSAARSLARADRARDALGRGDVGPAGALLAGDEQ